MKLGQVCIVYAYLFQHGQQLISLSSNVITNQITSTTTTKTPV